MHFTLTLTLAAIFISVTSTVFLEMSHVIKNGTGCWPAADRPSFVLTIRYRGLHEKGYWYESNSFCSNEHCGTHLDAPRHFAQNKWSAQEIPPQNIMVPVVWIDVSRQVTSNPDYELSVEDITQWESKNGLLSVNSVLLIHTGFYQFWDDRQRYYGSDSLNASDLHFPGVSSKTASWLTNNRKIAGIGIDTASIDPGTSRDFQSHQILGNANIYMLENVANIDKLPVRGATLFVLPLPIEDSSGSPIRLLASWDENSAGSGVATLTANLLWFVAAVVHFCL